MENNSIRISFILPFYGVEHYIGRCLDSIYEQDIPETEYEVICVNDCSPDNSEAIVRQYAQKHANLHLLYHEKNLRLGAARNTGLRQAKGKYVWFIDTDDFIASNCIREILSICESNELQILHFGIQDHHGEIIRSLIKTDVISGPEEELISNRQLCIEITYPWNRVYNREFLIQNNIWFNDLPGGDVVHTISAVNCCSRIKNVNKYYYFYRTNNYTSATKTLTTAKKIFDRNFYLAWELDKLTPSMDEKWRHLIAECGPWRVNTSIKSILKLSYSEQKEFYKLLYANREIYDFAMRVASRRVKFFCMHPHFTEVISLVYKILYKVFR